MKTADALLKQYGSKHPKLVEVARDYLGLSEEAVVNRRAAKGQLGGIRAFRLGSNKSPWLVDIEQVAEVLDAKSRG